MRSSRKTKLLILIIMSFSVFFIYKFTNHNNINYTVIGDSLSYGKDCYGQVDYGYSDYIKDYLESKNKLQRYSREYTQMEMTIKDLYNTLLSEENMTNSDKNVNLRSLLRDSDYLTMTIGLNDLLYKLSLINDVTDENINIIIKEIDESFDMLIEEIRKVYNRDIYVIGYYNFNSNNTIVQKAIKKLNNIYKKNPNVIYISSQELSQNPNVFLPNPNSYLPNYKGYQLISNKIIDKMAKKLEN